jgi:hypothetical protein
MRSLDFSIHINLPASTLALGLTQPVTEKSNDNLTIISELIVKKMLEPQHLNPMGLYSLLQDKHCPSPSHSSVTFRCKEFSANFFPAFVCHILTIILFQFIERYL